ncbi:site-specific integrase [Eubacteriaceae bacterium ES2]|nr:site-specific integrase [Eubacteriaceae bacterium ES2]
MPANYDKDAGTWTAQFYYTDYTGTRKKKKKRGFALKRDANDWERDFLEKQQADLTMLFSSLVELYFDDMKNRLRESTIKSKHYMIDLKIIPYFGQKPVNQIKPTDIRAWQNELISYRDDKGNPYSQTYLKTINNQLVAIFNYAVKYYDLKSNPCHKAGSMGKKNADEMTIWTQDEFNTFITYFEDRPEVEMAFMTFYYTGVRLGELIALTMADIDTTGGFIQVNKSKQRIDGKDVITDPKTPKSNRTITIPGFLCAKLDQHMKSFYDSTPNTSIFPWSKHFYTLEMKKGCTATGVQKIRLHDLRHSHASLLIELGFSPLLIAERLGHEKVETTLNTYSHLYPNKHGEVSKKLDELNNLEPK